MRFFHFFLLNLPPEWAHALGLQALRIWQWLYILLLKRTVAFSSPVIHIPSLSGLRFRSRVGIAAGFDKDAEVFAALALLGVGFVEVGTVTPLAQPGNPKPRLWRVGSGALINHLGFNSAGLGRFECNIARYRSRIPGVVLLANIGKNRQTPLELAKEDYRKGFEALKGKVDGFVVNLSSPNTPGLVDLQSERFLESLASLVPPGAPCFIKLSADLVNEDLSRLCSWINGESRFSGVVLTNTSREMAAEVFDRDRGGLSGRPLFSRALECVSIGRSVLGPGKVVIGVGGISDPRSARQMRQAGADLVEVYTGFVYRGPGLIQQLKGLE